MEEALEITAEVADTQECEPIQTENKSEIIDTGCENNEKESFFTPSFKEHVGDFSKSYPTVDIDALMKDEDFCLFIKGKSKETSFTQHYDAYRQLVSSMERRAYERAALKLASERASVGSLGSSESANDGFFSKEEVLRMSPQEIRRNYTKIRKSQEKW